MRHLLRSSAITLASLASIATVSAAEDDGSDVASILIGNDRYMAGPTVVSDAVEGDLSIAGGSVRVQNSVTGDLQAAGGDVTVSADINGDVRIGGGDVTLSGTIGEDVVIAGGNVHILPGTTIAGSVTLMGGDITMEGTIAKDLVVKGGRCVIAGSTGGTGDLRCETLTLNGSIASDTILASRKLSLGADAAINGDLSYWNEDGAVDFTDTVKGQTTVDSSLALRMPRGEEVAGWAGTIVGLLTLYSLLSAALVIALLLIATRTLFRDSAKALQQHPGKSFLTGFLYFIVTPIVVLLLMFTVIGIPLALALLPLYIISLFFAKILSSIVLARWLEIRLKANWHPVAAFFVSLAIFAVLKLLSLLPVVGWLTVLVLVWMGFGSLLVIKWGRYKKIR